MNTQIRIQGTIQPPTRLTEKSNFDKALALKVDNGIETHIEEYKNKSHKVSHSICPTESRVEIEQKPIPLSASLGFWTNYNDDQYKEVLRAKNELFKHS